MLVNLVDNALKYSPPESPVEIGATAGPDEVTIEVADRAPDADMAVSIAKSYVAEHAPDMVQKCVQLHGGIGYTWEHDMHLWFKRAKWNQLAFGDAIFQRERVAALSQW